jgi:hypothetical protein
MDTCTPLAVAPSIGLQQPGMQRPLNNSTAVVPEHDAFVLYKVNWVDHDHVS